MRTPPLVALAATLLIVGCSAAESPASSSAPPVSTPSPASPTPDECDFLPPAVDRRACYPPQAGDPPIPPSQDDDQTYILEVPGPIKCDVTAGGTDFQWAACTAGFELSPPAPETDCELVWVPDLVYLSVTDGVWQTGHGDCRGDPILAELETPPTLPVDRVLVNGEFAVLATEQGITVWNAEVRHGFAVLDGQVLTW